MKFDFSHRDKENPISDCAKTKVTLLVTFYELYRGLKYNLWD